MESFPEDFCATGCVQLPNPNDADMQNMLRNTRPVIVGLVREALAKFCNSVFLHIDGDGAVCVCGSLDEAKRLSANERLPTTAVGVSRRSFFLQRLAKELHERFGNRFKTLQPGAALCAVYSPDAPLAILSGVFCITFA